MSEYDLCDLDELARQWPIIFGKSLDPSVVSIGRSSLAERSGRPDFVDEKSPEIQRALRALARLSALSQDSNTRSAAEILFYARVVCGVEARQQGTAYLKIALACRSAPKKMTSTKEKELIAFGRQLYELACAQYRGGTLE
jgi:hypothetical protein